MKRMVFVISMVLALSALPHAENWPQFRGLQGGVANDDPKLPDTWSATENVIWKLDVPGYAWSSPVVWGDHVFITTAINPAGDVVRPTSEYLAGSLGGTMTLRDLTAPKETLRWIVYDVDFQTGKVRWERQVQQATPTQSRHQKNSYASETPVTDGERVYAYFSNAGLFAFDMSGRPVWSKPLDTLKTRFGWGGAASPVLYKDHLYIVNDNEERSFMAAYDAKTGREVWRVAREEATNWASPFV